MSEKSVPPDPRTLQAIEKIKALLTEYDLWGCFMVSDTKRAHWLYHVDASWSALHVDRKTGEARIRAKRADFATAEGHKRVIDLTVSAIFNSRDFASMVHAHMDQLAKMVERQVEVEHHPFTDVQYHDGGDK